MTTLLFANLYEINQDLDFVHFFEDVYNIENNFWDLATFKYHAR